jgi:hypothetical protein
LVQIFGGAVREPSERTRRQKVWLQAFDRSQSLFDLRRGGARAVAHPVVGDEYRHRVLVERRPHCIQVLVAFGIEVGDRAR